MARYIRTTVKSGDRPYLLKVSLLEPHYPYRTDPARYRRYYDAAPIYQESSCDHPVLSVSQDDRRVVVSEEEIRRATATYYGMVDAIDSRYAAILDALTDSGQNIDDWIIVYLSDHGEMLGQHGLWEKARFYEASVRAPLIIRWPKRFIGGTVVRQNVSLCDLFATLCDLAGLPVQPGLDSRTLVPLMDGRIDGWSDEVVSQIRRNRRDHVMIKRGSLKYQHYGVDIPDVLFDLDADPGELRNVIADPKYADAVAAFRTRLGELGYGPNADANYVNAGYSPGVPTSVITSGTLWRADANPWQESI
jgi:choline-sulfatase